MRLRLLIAEDSAVVREDLVAVFAEDPGFEVVGLARDGVDAVAEAVRLRPHVILMDVHMPRMGGYEATRRIMESVPAPIVMVSASVDADEVTMTFEALQAGALTVLPKPAGLDHPLREETAARLRETVRLMAEVKVVRRWPVASRGERRSPPVDIPTREVRVVALAASTGGPAAVSEILRDLPADFGVPILVVQHIAAGFVAGLAAWLGTTTPRAVKLAEPGEPARAGCVYLAPEARQLGVSRGGRIRITDEDGADGFRPSASWLFRSVAEAYGPAALGALLTGMGRDGADGLRCLRDAGGLTMAQDEASSVVFGMPAEAVRLGAAEYVLSPREIAAVIRSAAQPTRRSP